ncbi:MAG TPA: hypothetical protein VMD92_13235, partial [Acidobacteriaceae bacterium]|nr:hypothetical protein [Acidobacteriaceae bacterium]
ARVWRWSELGFGSQGSISAALSLLTTLTVRPSDVDFDWVPFVALSMGWYRLNSHLFHIGFTFNAILLYLAGWLIGKAWRGLRTSSAAARQ